LEWRSSYFLSICFSIKLFLIIIDIQRLKKANSKAEFVFDKHSLIFSKNFNFDIKTENELLKISSSPNSQNLIEIDFEGLEASELKEFTKSVNSKYNIISNQNQDLLNQIEKFKCLIVENEEIKTFQEKETERFKKMCRDLTLELKNKKTNQYKDPQIPIQIESEIKKEKLKKKNPDNSPINSNHEGDDLSPKWCKEEEILEKNSEDWGFQFINAQNKNQMKHIKIEIKNHSAWWLSISDIRISSSESKDYFKITKFMIKIDLIVSFSKKKLLGNVIQPDGFEKINLLVKKFPFSRKPDDFTIKIEMDYL